MLLLKMRIITRIIKMKVMVDKGKEQQLKEKERKEFKK
jgi:hypothetical protein